MIIDSKWADESGNFAFNFSMLLFNEQEWWRKVDLVLVEEAAALVRTAWVQHGLL